MEIISKVSKGTKMDQIYLPKNRYGLANGQYVKITPLQEKREIQKPFFYKIDKIEPIKVKIIQEIFQKISSYMEVGNIIISGSFLENGFNFQDVDILLVEGKDEKKIQMELKASIGIETHIISIEMKELKEGLSSDPLFENMLSKFVSLERVVFNYKRKIKRETLDLSLLKSKPLFDNFEFLTGKEKYNLVRNIIAICLFIEKEKINNENIRKRIKKELGIEIEGIKENLIHRKDFLKKIEKIYKDLEKRIMDYGR